MKKKRAKLNKRDRKAKVAKTVRKFAKGSPRPMLLGNEFWKARSSHGRKPIFAGPDDLLNAAEEYFAWNQKNPLYEDKVTIQQGFAIHEPVAKMRPLTFDGLITFLDINFQTWQDYCAKEGFSEVTQAITRVIRRQKFDGAAADLLNANIIARDLGLVDRSERSGNSGPSVVVINADPFQNIWDKLSGMMERLDGGQAKKLIER